MARRQPVSRRSRKGQTGRKSHTRKQRRTKRVKQRGGASDVPSGYPDTVVSYTPHSDEIGDVDMVPRIGSKEAFEADSAATA